jgi:hypothetical protein
MLEEPIQLLSPNQTYDTLCLSFPVAAPCNCSIGVLWKKFILLSSSNGVLLISAMRACSYPSVLMSEMRTPSICNTLRKPNGRIHLLLALSPTIHLADAVLIVKKNERVANFSCFCSAIMSINGQNVTWVVRQTIYAHPPFD